MNFVRDSSVKGLFTMIRRYVAIVFAVLCSGVKVDAQNLVIPKAQFILNFDYALFRNNDSTGYIEFYYAFYPRLITYEMGESTYCGGVKVNAIVTNKKTGEIVMNARPSFPVRVRDTADVSMSREFVSQAGYALPLGEYLLKIQASDSLAEDRRDSVAASVVVKPYAVKESCSDIELCNNIKNSTEKNDPFFKNSLEVIPNPTLVFGVVSHPMMYYYVEFYGLTRSKAYEVKMQVVSPEGAVIKEDVKKHTYQARNVVEAGNIHVTSILSGKYHLRIVLLDNLGLELAQSEKTFFVYNPHVKRPQVAASSIRAKELAGLTADELSDEFQRARYIASDDQIRTFSEITSADGRREFLVRFWNDIESARSTAPASIQRSDYLARTRAADERFRVMSREGWKTDRGRVYILYGEPDEIRRYPSSQNSRPYETWLYRQIENGVEFDFIDRSGFGDYVLVNSTKRGEIQDEQWDRQLQLR